MKTVHSLVAACFCALAFSFPTPAGELRNGAESAADRASWSEAMPGSWFKPTQRTPKNRVEVVEIGLDPRSAKVPGAIAAVLPDYDAVIKSLRGVVARDKGLSSSLKKQGYDVEDVLALGRRSDGTVSLFVGSSA
jgi:hypothetical protein